MHLRQEIYRYFHWVRQTFFFKANPLYYIYEILKKQKFSNNIFFLS